METVAFYSYKGGVGRTLLVANTAQFLAMSGRKVVALDLDLEAPGLHQKLGDRDVSKRAEAGTLRGAVDILLDMFSDEPEKGKLREDTFQVNLPLDVKDGSLWVMPAGAAPSHAYWTALEKLNHTLGANPRTGGLPEAVLELQERIEEEFKPDFLLIDSRTGITELGGLATSLLADRVVCLTTNAPESVDGTRVVAHALRNAPRLSSQKPLRIDLLITRVLSGSAASANVSSLINELGGSLKVLPHDSGIAKREQVWGRPGEWEKSDDDDVDKSGQELFSATLDWIAESFPGHKEEADRARRRMKAVHEAWQQLTRSWQRYRGGSGTREAWPVSQLQERVWFTRGKKSRQADIAAYDSAIINDHIGSHPLMVVEYVESEDRDEVAQWWLANMKPKLVVLISGQRGTDPPIRVVSRTHSSDRWWNGFPLPHDFKALADPADVSLDALLDGLRRCSAESLRWASFEYLDRIINEWVHCSASGLHGGVPWKPQLSRKIIDRLVRIDDVDLARRVLWAASLSSPRRSRWLGDGDDWIDEQVLADLFAPLLWRLPPDASVEILQESGRRGRLHGRPSGLLAIAMLARDLLGLDYDPDATFRVEGQRILERGRRLSGRNEDEGLYALTEAFRHTEISFEMSSESPSAWIKRTNDEVDAGGGCLGVYENVGDMIAERITEDSLVTTGLLGDYEARSGRVVLYKRPIALCADKLALQPRHVGSVTLIHETLHALMHLGRDLDGRMWPEFALPDPSSPLFEPSWFHETLTQYFTYQHILRLRDPALMHAFEAMSAKSAAPYRAWERLRNLPIEDARNWLMSVRRGVGTGSIPMQLVLEGMKET